MADELEEFLNSNEFLSSLFNNMSAAVFILDRDMRVLNINKSFSKLFQKSKEDVFNELCGNAIGCIFPVIEENDCGETVNCDVCEIRNNAIRCFTEKGGSLNTVVERKFMINDEVGLKYFYVTLKYFEFNDNGLALAIVNDVTELEIQRKRLAELNELKNEFLGTVSHDLRNPITQIMLASETLLKYADKLTLEDNLKFLNMIQRSSKFMNDLVNDLLDISKIEMGKLELKKTINDYVKFVRESLNLNRIIAKGKDITIETEFAENLPEIQFDRTKISQVLNNLIGNAIKYSPEGSKITVRIEKGDEFLITTVTDQGPGIPEKELALLFNEFQILSVKPTQGARSTGLGLAIAKKIVEKHEGTISVKNSPNRGSTFYFTLPL